MSSLSPLHTRTSRWWSGVITMPRGRSSTKIVLIMLRRSPSSTVTVLSRSLLTNNSSALTWHVKQQMVNDHLCPRNPQHRRVLMALDRVNKIAEILAKALDTSHRREWCTRTPATSVAKLERKVTHRVPSPANVWGAPMRQAQCKPALSAQTRCLGPRLPDSVSGHQRIARKCFSLVKLGLQSYARRPWTTDLLEVESRRKK